MFINLNYGVLDLGQKHLVELPTGLFSLGEP